MSRNITDIERVRNVAVMLLYLDIQPTKVPFVASHPFTDSWFVGIAGKNGEPEIVDLREVEAQKKWRVAKRSMIEEEDLIDILLMLIKPYRLFFLKEIQKVISDEDLGKCISATWNIIENISMDVNVSGTQMVSMFKQADKHTLMTEDEREYIEQLENEVVLYRGVTSYNSHKKKAMSWTLDKKRAEWFAKRFEGGAEVWKLVVPKNRILAYFDRGENEVIVNLYGYNAEIQKMELN